MQDVQNLREESLHLMSVGGYPIKEAVSLQIDKNLKIMGYTTEKEGKTLIVISEWSLMSGMVMGLLVHELSHVYRIETLHPSHNSELHNKVLSKVLRGKKFYEYQLDILYNTINNIQDLYADDISFSVYIKNAQKNINEFFLGWIHDPINPAQGQKVRWLNAGNLLNAAFAKANLERHNIEDTNGKVEETINNFLKKNHKDLSENFDYFKDLMVHLPEKISEEEFEKFLAEYLRQFLKLV